MPYLRTLCRLSVLFREPLHRVMQWPAAEVRLLEHYLSKQPAPDERIDIGLARFLELATNYLRAPKSRRATIRDFLPYFDPWNEEKPNAQDGRYSDVDREVIAAFGL